MNDQSVSVNTMTEQFRLYKNNPAAIKKVIYDTIESMSANEINVVDPTTPFNMLMESACVLTTAFMQEHEAALRKQYPSMAQTVEDLYLHMSDKDYIDRFASPAKTKFNLLIDVKELEKKLVLNPATGIRQVTIPKNSEFNIEDTVFSLQYPIDIKQLVHKGYQITYDTSEVSPLQRLETNVVPWSKRVFTVNNQEMLHLEFDVYQFDIASYKGDLLTSTGYKKRHKFADQFYFARVYFKNNATLDQWQEILTTHSDQVYDPQTPTAALKVIGSELEVTIPQVYLTTGLISGSLRVDIYQTKGALTLLLENYKPSAFSANFILIDKSKTTAEVAAFQSMGSVFAYANQTVHGGKNAISFAQLRQRVLSNAIGQKQLPITNVQVNTALENIGFDIVKNVDVITNRQFLATRDLPEPFDDKLITAASASIETFITSIDQLRTHSQVKDNGERVTIVPEMLFENVNGIIKSVTESEAFNLAAGPKDDLIVAVSQRNFLYTPFHYVLDTTNNNFELRPYYLNGPRTEPIGFVSQNDLTGLQVNTGDHQLVKTATGYKLYIETVSNQDFKDLDDQTVFVQLAFTPYNESSKAYLNGTLISNTETDERLFEFDITSEFDIDSNNNIFLTSFDILTSGSFKLPCPLQGEFEIYYSTSAPMPGNWAARTEDAELGRFLLPPSSSFITKEQITLTFGKVLDNLWASARTIPSASPYMTYSSNVYALYEEDVYERDEEGRIFTLDNSGNITYNQLHSKGDVVLNANNEPVIKHKAGDVIFDQYGMPLPIGQNTLVRQMDMMFIQGCYYFSTDTVAVTYRDTITDIVVNWITEDLKDIGLQLLEQTQIYYYPKMSIGNIKAITNSGSVVSLRADQEMNVRLYVPEMTYNNSSLRERLSQQTIKQIDKHFRNSTISVSTLTSELKELYQNDVIAFNVKGFGVDNDIQVLSTLNDSDHFSIKKTLRKQPDGKLIVTEAVTVDFLLHNPE